MSLHKVAMTVGADVLPARIPAADEQIVWNNLSRQQRVETFLSWLSEPSSTASVLLFDDVDALADVEGVAGAIGSCAHTVLFSSRKPKPTREFVRKCSQRRVSISDIGYADSRTC